MERKLEFEESPSNVVIILIDTFTGLINYNSGFILKRVGEKRGGGGVTLSKYVLHYYTVRHFVRFQNKPHLILSL